MAIFIETANGLCWAGSLDYVSAHDDVLQGAPWRVTEMSGSEVRVARSTVKSPRYM